MVLAPSRQSLAHNGIKQGQTLWSQCLLFWAVRPRKWRPWRTLILFLPCFKYLFDLEFLSFRLNIVWKFQLNLLPSRLLKQICLWTTLNKNGKQRYIQKACFIFQSNGSQWDSSLDFYLNLCLWAERNMHPEMCFPSMLCSRVIPSGVLVILSS